MRNDSRIFLVQIGINSAMKTSGPSASSSETEVSPENIEDEPEPAAEGATQMGYSSD